LSSTFPLFLFFFSGIFLSDGKAKSLIKKIIKDSNFIIPNRFIEPVIVEVKDEYEYKDLYEIKKETKLNQDFFNFIDHPYFSILIRVQEY